MLKSIKDSWNEPSSEPSSARVLLAYPPVSSVWHLPAGIGYLSGVLSLNGHNVLQSCGHVAGLEYVLLKHDPINVRTALETVRDRASSVLDIYHAYKVLERVSKEIRELTVTEHNRQGDMFEVRHNNVTYVSWHYDGTIESILAGLENKEEHLWYEYFVKVELRKARDFQTDIYGISVADERQFFQAMVLAAVIKEGMPECRIVLWGNFWTRVIDIFHNPLFAKFFDYCDAIVYREGFQPIQEFASWKNISEISGTVWRNPEGKVIVNAPTQELTPFASLPAPVFDDVDARQWWPDEIPSFFTMSRCPHSCSFCAIHAGADDHEFRSGNNSIAPVAENPSIRAMTPRQIALHMQYSGKHRFQINDETFPIPRQLAVWKELQELGYEATWECYLTMDNRLLQEETCRALYASGCRCVQLGLETLSPETLKSENKKWNSPENYGQILKNLKEAGIQTHVFIITGLPDEPLEQWLNWIPFFEKYWQYITTIKAGRYRATRKSPDVERGTVIGIKLRDDSNPLHLNREFDYVSDRISHKKVAAMRTILEELCRRHHLYQVTSTIPWWSNRWRYTWDELESMAQTLKDNVPEEPINERELRMALDKIPGIIALSRYTEEIAGILKNILGKIDRCDGQNESVILSHILKIIPKSWTIIESLWWSVFRKITHLHETNSWSHDAKEIIANIRNLIVSETWIGAKFTSFDELVRYVTALERYGV